MIHMFIIPANDRIDDCIAIRKKVFVEEQGVPVELEVDEMDSPSAPCFHFLMLDDEKAGEPVPFGTFRAYYEAEDTVHLQRFCVLKEYRAQGLGRAGFEFVSEFFRLRGAKKLTFGAQCTAIPFYEKCGCRCVSDVFLDAGLPHRTMEKALN